MDPVTIGLALSLGAKYIPELVGYLFGDNAGAVATDVGKVVQAVTGTSDPAAADAVLASNPQLVADLRKQALEIKDREDQRRHDEVMAKQASDDARMKALFDDAISARNRDAEFIKAGKRNTRADVLLIVAGAGIISGIGFMVFGHIEGNTAVGGCIISVVTLLATKFGTAFDFEFGSSRDQQNTVSLLAQAPAIGGK